MLYFALKESVRSIGRTKLAFFFSLFSMTTALLLIQLSVIAYFLSAVLEEKIIETFKINIFLEENITPDEIKSTEEELRRKPYTKELEYISKEKAAADFIKETGEDFRDILDFNPLPASFTLTPDRSYMYHGKSEEIIKDLRKLQIATSIEFQNSFLNDVNKYMRNANRYIVGLTIFLIILAVYMVYSTLRLIIQSKKEEIETMKLVGASTFAIKLPIILNGILLGLLAGIITIGVMAAIHLSIRNQFDVFMYLNQKNYLIYIAVVFLIGPFLGWFISILTLRRVSLRF